jgi:hypothetical protein
VKMQGKIEWYVSEIIFYLSWEIFKTHECHVQLVSS